MIKLAPYLNFDGTTEEAFNFYKKIFGTDFSVLQRFKDIPPQEGQPPVPAQEAERIMHVALPIGDVMLMGTDTSPSRGHTLTLGNNVSLSISPNSKEETERIFKELSEGGKVEMPLTKMFWGGWFASFDDKFGVPWMINFQEDPIPESFNELSKGGSA